MIFLMLFTGNSAPDITVEENEDETKLFALTFYGIENPEKVKNLCLCEVKSRKL